MSEHDGATIDEYLRNEGGEDTLTLCLCPKCVELIRKRQEELKRTIHFIPDEEINYEQVDIKS